MNKLTLSGIIHIPTPRYSEFTNWHKLKLIQPDAYQIDMISRISEFLEFWDSLGKSFKVQVNYWISPAWCTPKEAQEEFLKDLFGSAEAGYKTTYYTTSAYACEEIDYDSIFKVGKHDLFLELSAHQGKHVIMEINIVGKGTTPPTVQWYEDAKANLNKNQQQGAGE